jgi:iron complex transport system ATP-binding protein
MIEQMQKLNLGIDGTRCEIKEDTLIITMDQALKTLSSSILGGGFSQVRYILNHHVEKDFNHEAPATYLKNVALEMGIEGPVVGMMTAADLSNLAVINVGRRGLKINAIITGGISNAAAVGEKTESRRSEVGTINTIVIVDGSLYEGALVGAIITITEAKSAALRELNVINPKTSGLATGTTTDSVVVACTGRGPPLEYAGTGTLLGELIGRSVKKGTKEAVAKQEGWE